MSFSERLLLIINELGENRNSFSEMLGYKNNSYIYDYTRTKPEPKEPGFDFFKRFIQAKTGISLYWLITGEGEMYEKNIQPQQNGSDAAVKATMEKTINILREENMKLLNIVELALKRGGSNGA